MNPNYLFGYGALGSQVLSKRIGRPNIPTSPAYIEGYERCFAGWSRTWGGSVASLRKKSGAITYGSALYLKPGDLEALDPYEGYPRVYRREKVTIVIDGEKVPAWVYLHNAKCAEGPPSVDYLKAIAANIGEHWTEGGRQLTYKDITVRMTPCNDSQMRRNPQKLPSASATYVNIPPTPAQARCKHYAVYRDRTGTECSICGSKKFGDRWQYLDERSFHYYTSGKVRPNPIPDLDSLLKSEMHGGGFGEARLLEDKDRIFLNALGIALESLQRGSEWLYELDAPEHATELDAMATAMAEYLESAMASIDEGGTDADEGMDVEHAFANSWAKYQAGLLPVEAQKARELWMVDMLTFDDDDERGSAEHQFADHLRNIAVRGGYEWKQMQAATDQQLLESAEEAYSKMQHRLPERLRGL